MRFTIFIILFLIFLGWLVFQLLAENPPEVLIGPSMAIIQGNSLLPISPVYVPHTYIYGSIIDCLEWRESRGNENAYGKAGECGCMQFLPSTFEAYCEGNIWSCEDQRRCADYMLQENFNNIRHWTTAKYCH